MELRTLWYHSSTTILNNFLQKLQINEVFRCHNSLPESVCEHSFAIPTIEVSARSVTSILGTKQKLYSLNLFLVPTSMDPVVIYSTLLIRVFNHFRWAHCSNVTCSNFFEFYFYFIVGNKAGINRLLQQGLNVDETDKNNYTPLIYAARKGKGVTY